MSAFHSKVFGIVVDTATPLELQVVALGSCPRCHKKTLELKYSCEDGDFYQCWWCLTVYGLEKDLVA